MDQQKSTAMRFVEERNLVCVDEKYIFLTTVKHSIKYYKVKYNIEKHTYYKICSLYNACSIGHERIEQMKMIQIYNTDSQKQL